MNNAFSRQIMVFGTDCQNRISECEVGIVGLGGIGAQIAQALTHLGVTSFVLIDDDHVDITNLNRLIGARPSDATTKTPKVAVAERNIHLINPQARVRAIAKNLRSAEALEALISCPIIFGCVDHDAPRLILTELAAAYSLLLIDCGVEIMLEGGGITEFGGRVVFARAGDYCLDCARQIDMEQAKLELESPETQEIRQKHGYGMGANSPSPAVTSLNGVVANLAVTEFIAYVSKIREPFRHLTYYGLRGKVNVREDRRRNDCYFCGYVAGQGTKADIFRYAASGE